MACQNRAHAWCYMVPQSDYVRDDRGSLPKHRKLAPRATRSRPPSGSAQRSNGPFHASPPRRAATRSPLLSWACRALLVTSCRRSGARRTRFPSSRGSCPCRRPRPCTARTRWCCASVSSSQPRLDGTFSLPETGASRRRPHEPSAGSLVARPTRA